MSKNEAWSGAEEPELAPDLEWMLQSGQAGEALLVGALVKAYFAPLHRLALSLLDDPGEAAYGATETIVQACLNAYRYHSELGVKTWLYRIALEVCRRLLRRLKLRRRLAATLPFLGKPADFGASTPETEREAAAWLEVAALQEQRRLALLLECVHGWEAEEIARLLGENERGIRKQLQGAQLAIRAALYRDGLDDENLSGEEWEAGLRRLLQKRWPAPEFTEAGLEVVAAEILEQVGRQGKRRSGLAHLREAMLVGAVMLVVGAAIWGANRFLPEPKAGQELQPGSASTASPAPTSTPPLTLVYQVEPGDSLPSIAAKLGIPAQNLAELNRLEMNAELHTYQELRLAFEQPPWESGISEADRRASPRMEPLDPGADPEEIRRYLALSDGRWGSAWLDGRFINYGPQGYVGPPAAYRFQTWANQPDQRLEISGPLTAGPSLAALSVGGLEYMIYPDSGQVQVRPAEAGQSSSWMGDLLLPSHSRWFELPGELRVVDRGEIAGRQAVVVDWMREETGEESGMGDQNPDRLRIWIDALTGVILRNQYYGGVNAQTLLYETVVTAIEFEVKLPALFDPYAARQVRFASDPSGQPLPSPAPGSEVPIPEPAPGHTRLPLQPPPPGFDPAHSQLTFQYPADYRSEDPESPAPVVELFADAYTLGSLELADPWGMRCHRSPDGKKIAWLTPHQWGLESRTVQPGWFGWLELSNVRDVQIPHNALEVFDFAFAPDSQRLALLASQESMPYKIYILNTVSGENTVVGELMWAESLVWSPDGQHLAMMASSGIQTEALVMRVQDGEIVYRTAVESSEAYSPDRPADWPAPDWPGHEWGVKFPDDNYGLEGCILPPEG